jgi:hypothetical protein
MKIDQKLPKNCYNLVIPMDTREKNCLKKPPKIFLLLKISQIIKYIYFLIIFLLNN